MTAILQKELSLSITEDNDSSIGITLVIIGLFYNVITVYFEKYLLAIKQNTGPKHWDIQLFDRFLNEFPSGDTTEFLRQHNFEDLFHYERLDPLLKFALTWDNAESEFLDEEIEELRKKLLLLSKSLFTLMSVNTYPQGLMQTTIPTVYVGAVELPDTVKQKITELNETATQVYEAHQAFIRKAKKKIDL
jgi:hypothetical protein